MFEDYKKDVEIDSVIRAYGKKFEKPAEEDIPFVNEFCRKYDVELLGIRLTEESGEPELSYEFSDEQGYYTRAGLEESLSN